MIFLLWIRQGPNRPLVLPSPMSAWWKRIYVQGQHPSKFANAAIRRDKSLCSQISIEYGIFGIIYSGWKNFESILHTMTPQPPNKIKEPENAQAKSDSIWFGVIALKHSSGFAIKGTINESYLMGVSRLINLRATTKVTCSKGVFMGGMDYQYLHKYNPNSQTHA